MNKRKDFVAFCEETLSLLAEGEDPDAVAQACQYFAVFEAKDNHANNALALCELRDMAAEKSRRELDGRVWEQYPTVADDSRENPTV